MSEPAPKARADRPEHRQRVLLGGCGDLEAVGLDDPARDERQRGERHERKEDDTAEAEGARAEAVHDRDQPRPDPVAGGDERDRLGSLRRRRLLGGGRPAPRRTWR